MFAYMLVTQKVMGMLNCRSIQTGSVVVTVSSVDPGNGGQYSVTRIFIWRELLQCIDLLASINLESEHRRCVTVISGMSCGTFQHILAATVSAIIFVMYTIGFPLWIVYKSSSKVKRRLLTVIGHLQKWCLPKSKSKRATDDPLLSDPLQTYLQHGRRLALPSLGTETHVATSQDKTTDKLLDEESESQMPKSAKYTTFCRVSFVFNREHHGWMAILLWRRALVVYAYILARSWGGEFYLHSGQSFDYRAMPFVLLLCYVIAQAHCQPFALSSDNILEQCVLVSLLFIIYADISLRRSIFDCKMEEDICVDVQLNTVVVFVTAVIMAVVIAIHKVPFQTHPPS
eukprot:SAG31_NODE_705_length_12695_cov_3.147007_16_plen_343_part_00